MAGEPGDKEWWDGLDPECRSELEHALAEAEEASGDEVLTRLMSELDRLNGWMRTLPKLKDET